MRPLGMPHSPGLLGNAPQHIACSLRAPPVLGPLSYSSLHAATLKDFLLEWISKRNNATKDYLGMWVWETRQDSLLCHVDTPRKLFSIVEDQG